MKINVLLLSLLFFSVTGSAVADAIFGRLYTTPTQREQLDEARINQARNDIVVEIVEENVSISEDEVDIVDISPSISLDGIVYRTDGKNTAWINRRSSNEGNLETQFTKIGEKDVQSNRVKITLPDNQTRIDLKVGQQYNINSREISEVTNVPTTTTPVPQQGTLP